MGKKRYKKGIESLKKEITIHKGKLEEAERRDNVGLAAYYKEEIENMKQNIKKKQLKLTLKTVKFINKLNL